MPFVKKSRRQFLSCIFLYAPREPLPGKSWHFEKGNIYQHHHQHHRKEWKTFYKTDKEEEAVRTTATMNAESNECPTTERDKYPFAIDN